MPVTESIQINITASTTSAVQNVGRLNAMLGAVKDSMDSLQKKQGLAINVPKDIADRITKLSIALHGLRGMTKSINIKIKPEDVVEKIDKVAEGLEKIDGAIARLRANTGQINFTSFLNGVDSRVKKVEESMAGINRTSSTFRVSGKQAANTFKELGGQAKSLLPHLKKVFQLLAMPYTAIGRSVKNTTERFNGLFRSLKRVAMYRLLRTALKEISKALKEGVENLYQYSIITGTQFSKSLDMMATAALYVKNSLATIAEPIVNRIAPLIDMLADKFAEFSHKAAEFLAALFGQATYSKAIKYPTEFAEAAGKASKELQKWLGPFDEINRLNKANASGSADSLDYRNMFETVLVDGDGLIAQLAKRLKDAIKSGDFSGISTELGTKLANALKNIDWQEIKTRARQIGNGIGTSITGFITAPDMTVSVGHSIAELLNTGIAFFDTLTRSLDFERIGKALGDGISTLLKDFDFIKFVGTIVNFGVGFVKFLTSLISSVPWDEFGNKVGEAIRNIDWKEVFTTVWNLGGAILTAIFDSIGGAIDGILGTEKGTGKVIAEGIAVAGLVGKFGSLLSKIIPINSAFSDKNRLLQDQTKYTNAEAGAVNALSGAFTNATAPIGSLSGALGVLGVVLTLVTALSKDTQGGLGGVKDAARDATKEMNNAMNALVELTGVEDMSLTGEMQQLALQKALKGANTTATKPIPTNTTQAAKPTIVDSLGSTLGIAAGAGLAVAFANGGGKGMSLAILDDKLAPGYASGGIVSSDVFLARENGAPELVGRMGNKTAVANNAQIVDGVAAGVAEANGDVVNAIYAMASQIVNAIRTSGGTGNFDWNGMARQLSRVQARQAMSANV